MTPSHRAVISALFALAFVITPLFQASAKGWEVVHKEAGITVSSKPNSKSNLPLFRGKGAVPGHILEVLAVLNDTPRSTEWMHNCMESRVLKVINDKERILYNRTDAPWPVDDRDVVLQSKAEVLPEKSTVLIRFHSIKSPLQKEVDGVVRMPTLKGLYKLEYVSENKTLVTYEIDANSGGLLPDWLIERASQDLPLQTLLGLRKQVKKTRGQHKKFVEKWKPDFDRALKEKAATGK